MPPEATTAKSERERRQQALAAQLREERATCSRLQRDCQGLSRINTRLVLNSAQQVSSLAQGARQVQESCHIQNESLLQSIGSKYKALVQLSEQVSSEREKTCRLREELSNTLQEGDRRLAELRLRCVEQDEASARELQLLQEQQAIRSACLEDLVEVKAAGAAARQEQERHRSRAWHLRKSSQLEAKSAQLTAELARCSGRHVDTLAPEAAEAQALLEVAGSLHPPAMRVRRVALRRLAEVQAAKLGQLTDCAGLERDCQGLLKSGRRVFQKLSAAEQQVAALGETDKDARRIEEESLREAIESMTQVHKQLEASLAAQRGRSSGMRAAVEARLASEEEGLAELRGRVAQMNQEAELLEAQLAGQAGQQALRILAECQAAAQQTGATVRQERDRRSQVALKLHEARKSNLQLRAQVKASASGLKELNERHAESQRLWRLQHMEHVDARANRRRALDKEIVVPEPAVMALASAGG